MSTVNSIMPRQVEATVTAPAWPIDPDGALPIELFPPEYLHGLFFGVGLAKWKVSPVVVRRGLKVFAKRVAGPKLDAHLNGSQGIERDAALVGFVCETAKIRQRFSSIEFLPPQRKHPIKLFDFAQTLWTLGYGKGQTDWLVKLGDWFHGVAVPDPHRPGIRFLRSSALEEALSAGGCPSPISDVAFARAVLLYASLLEVSERHALLVTAKKWGACLPESCDPEISGLSDVPQAQDRVPEGTDGAVELLPRLKTTDIFEIPAPELSKKASDRLAHLDRLRKGCAEREYSTRSSFANGVEQLVKGASGEFEKAISGIQAWRLEWLALDDAEREAVEALEAMRGNLSQSIGMEVALPSEYFDEELFKELEYATWAVEKFDPSLDVFQVWRLSLKAPVSLERFKELPLIEAQRQADFQAGEDFERALSSILPGALEADVRAWLPALSPAELLHVAKVADERAGAVLRPILMAFGVERHGAVFAELAANEFLPELGEASRRSALRFIQKSSARLDGAPNFRRFVIREHFANLLVTGPLAQIADMSVGTGELNLVGRSIVLFVEAISENLDIVSDKSEIQRRLNIFRRAGDNTAARAAVEFIRSPPGMSGHFRRLRECAREQILLPLLNGEGINIRLAKEVIRQINSGEAEEVIVGEVSKALPGNDKIESQHRVQLARYLQSSLKILEACVRVEANKVDARTAEFAERVELAIEGMASGGPVGSVAWLEGELLMLLSREPGLGGDPPSLLGDEQTVSERRWTLDDEGWRDRTIASVIFYGSNQPSIFDVLCHILVFGNQDAEQIVDQLVENEEFSGALRFSLEVAGKSTAFRGLRKRVEEAASPHLRDARSTLERLEQIHGGEAVRSAEAYLPLIEAVSNLRIEEANGYASFLAVELEELQQRAHRDAAAARDRVASAELLNRLSRAGDSSIEAEASLEDLESRWARILDAAAGRRTHLLAAEKLVRGVTAEVPEFAPLLPMVAELRTRSMDPDWWLPEETAKELTDYLKSSSGQISTWIDVVEILGSDTLRTLSALIAEFLTFLYERSGALRAASAREEVDSMLEAVIEFDAAISSKGSPTECLFALAAAGFINDDNPSLERAARSTGNARREAADFAKSVANAVAAKAWQELYLLAVNARAHVSDDEAQRVDDVADFASVMLGLEAGGHSSAYEMLDGAARAVCAAGHPIHRALSERERHAAILRMLECAIVHDRKGACKVEQSWSGILSSSTGLFRIQEIDSARQLSRVLSIIFASAMSFELSDRVWGAATNASDAPVVRGDLLRYLHDLGQFDVIVRLCGKYDSAIKAKMEQMLELRAVAAGRPDLIPVAEALGAQIASSTKLAPVRHFLKRLPTAAPAAPGNLKVILQDDLVLRNDHQGGRQFPISVTAIPDGVVPSNLQVQVFSEDDVTFSGKSGRIMTLTDELLYAPKDFIINVSLGATWDDRISRGDGASLRLRFSAKTVTESVVAADLDVPVVANLSKPGERSIDRDSLLEFYPGVGNTPAVGSAFVGRAESLEQLHDFLIAARQPSPILLTGMRRVGKTSLLQEFHRRHRRPGGSQALSVYLSISELRHQFVSPDASVSATLYRAIGRALSKRDFSFTDHNRELGERLKQIVNNDRGGMRGLVQEAFDPDSLADSLMVFADRILDAVGGNTSRLILLLDEAESLVVPYNHGGLKKIELEQLLQSLREVSQASDRISFAISGSNHIAAFAREYKNAFFGSCVNLELEGLTSFEDASMLIAPPRVRHFVDFEPAAIQYGVELCGGMPQFMWQLGAATAYAVRSGRAFRADVRSAIGALVDGDHTRLPFKTYDVLEPIEHMLGLQGDREQDLLWLLLRRVALTSSLTALHAPRHFLIESSLLELDSRASWQKRLQTLVDLKILTLETGNSYRFKVPLFAEAFRTAKAEYDAEAKMRRLAT